LQALKIGEKIIDFFGQSEMRKRSIVLFPRILTGLAHFFHRNNYLRYARMLLRNDGDPMKPIDRQKMCINCDARIAVDAKECPFCGADNAQETSHTPPPSQKNQSLQDSLTSLYSPPYPGKSATYSTHVDENPKKPTFQTVTPEKKAAPSAEALNAEEQEEKSVFWPLLMLSAGSLALTLGLLQFFFSERGFLRLEWNSSYWFFYCLFALPLLYFGYKKSSQ
jgi:hypothetical protein